MGFAIGVLKANLGPFGANQVNFTILIKNLAIIKINLYVILRYTVEVNQW